MMSRPYAGSGSYIERMSTYCGDCRYSPRERTGERACPVTALYSDFLARHRGRFAGNRRMRLPLRTLVGMDEATLRAMREHAEGFAASLG
jgi:deoxyribodipyrimidine photolyase-related protein